MVELESPPMPTCTSQKRSRDHNKLSYFCHLRCFFFCGLSTSLGSYAHIYACMSRHTDCNHETARARAIHPCRARSEVSLA